MKKLFFWPFLMLLLTILSHPVLSQVKLKIKGLGYPLVVEVSGYVPRGYKAYERHYNKNDGATYESNDGLWLGVTAIVGGEEKDFAWKIKPVKHDFRVLADIDQLKLDHYYKHCSPTFSYLKPGLFYAQ